MPPCRRPRAVVAVLRTRSEAIEPRKRFQQIRCERNSIIRNLFVKAFLPPARAGADGPPSPARSAWITGHSAFAVVRQWCEPPRGAGALHQMADEMVELRLIGVRQAGQQVLLVADRHRRNGLVDLTAGRTQ